MTKRVQYSVPYNGDLELMKWAIASGQVYEIYFSGGEDYSSGYQNLRKNAESEVGALIKLCAEKGIGRNLLMNKRVLYFDNVKDILAYIKSLEQYGGITSITISDRMIVPYLAKAFPDITIQSSVFLHIDTANKVREGWKMGVKSFCLDVLTNRNGQELEKIRDLKAHYPGMTIKLLANHGCFQHCFFLPDHEIWPALKDVKAPEEKPKYMLGNMVDGEKCLYQPKNDGDEIKRSFIRPEDIAYYEQKGLMDYVKICYRMDKTPVLKTKMKAYFDRSYDGDLFDVTPSNRGQFHSICENKGFPEGFVEKVLYCGFACETCNYCDKVGEKVFKSRESVKVSA
jgi:collagenase-like PrtC family protease